MLFAVLGTGLWFFMGTLIPPGPMIVNAVFTTLCILPAVVLTLLFLPPSTGRFGIKGMKWSLVGVSAALAVPLFMLLRSGVTASDDSPAAVALAALALVFYAVHEEFAFRLFLTDALSMGNRFPVGASLSSLLFMAVHLDNPFSDLAGMINIFLAGMGLCLLRAMGGGMVGAVAAHFLWNASTGIVMGFGVSGYGFPSVWRPAAESGAFGPESSPVLTVVLAGLVVAGAVSFRRRGTRG